MELKFRIAILTSGNGSNAEEIFKYFKNHPTIEVAVLLSNNPNAYALERAKKANIPMEPALGVSEEALKTAFTPK